MTKQMLDDVLKLASQYKNNNLALDSMDSYSQALTDLFTRWKKFAKLNAEILASNFIEEVNYDTLDKLKSVAEQYITIQSDYMYKMIAVKKRALINENVRLITNLPEKMYNEIYQDTMNMILEGGNLYQYFTLLKKRGIETNKRAKLISRDQLFKATNIINNERMLANGINKSEWRHSHGDKVPRQSHLQASGKIYNNEEGCLIDGEYILPGYKINCTCFAIPVIEIK